jgi:uncharacterized repeat protein (TIGR04076 family)
MTHSDEFLLFDLKVEVIGGEKPFMCSHVAGSYFLVQGENLVFENVSRFSMYSLAALLPLLPAKQRPLQPTDWMTTDCDISCPDPHCGAKFRISRTTTRTLRHSETSAVPLPNA